MRKTCEQVKNMWTGENMWMNKALLSALWGWPLIFSVNRWKHVNEQGFTVCVVRLTFNIQCEQTLNDVTCSWVVLTMSRRVLAFNVNTPLTMLPVHRLCWEYRGEFSLSVWSYPNHRFSRRQHISSRSMSLEKYVGKRCVLLTGYLCIVYNHSNGFVTYKALFTHNCLRLCFPLILAVPLLKIKTLRVNTYTCIHGNHSLRLRFVYTFRARHCQSLTLC